METGRERASARLPAAVTHRLCSSFTVIMLHIFASLYAFAPLKLPPSIISNPLPISRPFWPPRLALGYTKPPPIVFELPVMEPTMIMRASCAYMGDARAVVPGHVRDCRAHAACIAHLRVLHVIEKEIAQ